MRKAFSIFGVLSQAGSPLGPDEAGRILALSQSITGGGMRTQAGVALEGFKSSLSAVRVALNWRQRGV